MSVSKKDSTTVTVLSRHASDASEDSLLLYQHHQTPHLGLFSTVILFTSRIMGSGIWATPATVFLCVGGNLTLFFSLWIIAVLVAFAGLFCYLELGSILPHNGGTKVFLEWLYPRPRALISVTFGLVTLMLSTSLTNAIVFGKYTLAFLGYNNQFIEETRWASFTSAALIIVVTIVHSVSVRMGVIIQNSLGVLKLILVAVSTLTGIYALLPSSYTGVENYLEWDQFTTFEPNTVVSTTSIITGLLQCFFTFGGWQSVHTIASEIKDPNRTFKIAGPLSLALALLNFTLLNLAMVKVIPHDELMHAGPLVGSILFQKLLGDRTGTTILTFTIALSALTNVTVVLYALARMNQEVFRLGIVPFSHTLAQDVNGAPIAGLLLSSSLTLLWILVLPSQGSSFQYVVSLESYPSSIFLFLIALGIFVLRYRQSTGKYNIPKKAPIRVSLTGVLFLIFVMIIVLVSPWLSPSGATVGHLPSYHTMGLAILGTGLFYWWLTFKLFPWYGGYELIEREDWVAGKVSVKSWVKERKVLLGQGLDS